MQNFFHNRLLLFNSFSFTFYFYFLLHSHRDWYLKWKLCA